MSRTEFMRRLAELLADVSPAEREEAIQYYNDYFDDAGAENEQSVIAALGTPESLAKTIKAGLFDGGNTGEFTENGFSGYEQSRNNEVLNPNQPGVENEQTRSDRFAQDVRFGQNDRFGQNRQSGQNDQFSQNTQFGQNAQFGQNGQQQWQGNNSYTAQSQSGKNQGKQPMSAGSVVLLVLLCILASPLLVGIGGGALGIIIGIFGGLFGIVVGLGAASVALLIVGVWLFVYGITLLFAAPLGGLCMMGAAMVCMAIGLFFLWIVVTICAVLIPLVVRGIVKLFHSIFHRGGAAA